MRITAEQYFAGYPDHPAITDEVRSNADAMLAKVNARLDEIEAAGVTLEANSHPTSPHSGTLISGEGNGGWRPPECPIGAPRSRHKLGKAVDLFDPYGDLDKHVDENPGMLISKGMAREAPTATPGWCHMQDGLPPSGHETFQP